ncbi:MAG: DUF4386 domain-containing protein [Actinomycetota bacterium]
MTDTNERQQMDPKKLAKAFGILFILTWVTAIAGRELMAPVYSEPRFILGDGATTGVLLGAAFEFLLIVTNIGTAVVLYPIARRYTQTGAVGYVTARIVECTFILVGLLSLLSVVALRQDLAGGAGADTASLVTAGSALTATYDWAFLFGPGLMAGVGNGLILGYVMYRSGLVPRRLAMLGLAGGSIHVLGFCFVLFGAIDAGSAGQFLFSIGEMAWEATLPIYVLLKGFKTTGIISSEESAPTPAPSMAPA